MDKNELISVRAEIYTNIEKLSDLLLAAPVPNLVTEEDILRLIKSHPGGVSIGFLRNVLGEEHHGRILAMINAKQLLLDKNLRVCPLV